MSTSKFRIIHYNDVYNIDVKKSEPIGGASRFVTAAKGIIAEAEDAECIVTFAGDAFSPAPLTPYTKGAEMPPIMNMVQTSVACIGNHELDNGLDTMKQRISETNCAWVLSNVYEETTGLPLGGVNPYYILEKSGVKFGFFGLASKEWFEPLTAIDHKNYVFVDPVTAADNVSSKLREMGCNVIICLGHLIQADDELVATNAKDVDIILSGHDHIVWKKQFENGRWAIKAGSDFKNIGVIDFTFSSRENEVRFEHPKFVDVTSEIQPDPEAEKFVQQELERLKDPAKNKELVLVKTVLDGRFFSIRTQETGLGNLVCDSFAYSTGIPNVIYNSGAFRSDNVDYPSPWTQAELEAVLPFHNEILVIKTSGTELLKILEASVGQYPLYSGYFLQVSGINFTFNPKKSTGSRVQIDSASAICSTGERVSIQGDKIFHIVTSNYMFKQYCSAGILSEDNFVRDENITGAEMVAQYMKSIETDTDKDGVNELGVVSPKIEGRIICTSPDPELVKLYPIPQ